MRPRSAARPVVALQSKYSIWWTSIEAEILTTLEELGIGLVPYSSLGRGYLTGKIDPNQTFVANDIRKRNPRFTAEAMVANQPLLELLVRIAKQNGATPAQIALAWLLAQKPFIVPIPGTRKLHRLEENMGAANIALTADDLREIGAEVAQIQVQGARGTGNERHA